MLKRLFWFESRKLIIVVDDDDRDLAEGDLVGLAELVSPENVNFMTKHARGLIVHQCLRRLLIVWNLFQCQKKIQMHMAQLLPLA